MRTFSCTCGNMLFYENTLCLKCSREVGWCPACRHLRPLETGESGLHCGDPACGAPLQKCHNYAVENVCNRCLLLEGTEGEEDELCDACRFNNTIPDLNVPGNREKWLRLEQAKRRLLYQLDFLGLSYGTAEDGFPLPLSFSFKGDTNTGSTWRSLGETEQVYTGHAHGEITINIREADDVEREKARVSFKERHRTIIGHFRHEIAHYYWELLVAGQCEPEFVQVFGDHNNPAYDAAMKQYYANGPDPDWTSRYISAYASMHPWEDFAETFAAYLDVAAVLDTADHLGFAEAVDPVASELDDMVTRYQILGVKLNELNRAMGLIDFVPEVFNAVVVEKMRFVHDLVKRNRNGVRKAA